MDRKAINQVRVANDIRRKKERGEHPDHWSGSKAHSYVTIEDVRKDMGKGAQK